MKKYLQKKLDNEKGMTLIELLAVIVIIAIIAAIAIPAIGNIIENSRVGSMKADASNVLSAANLYEQDGNTPTTTGIVLVSELISKGYIEDSGTIPGAGSISLTNLTISATATNGDLSVEFIGANKGTVNSMPNNTEGTYSPTETTVNLGTIEVDRDGTS